MAANNKDTADPLWVFDARILFRSDRVHEFFPYFHMRYNERINALTRLVLYCSAALSIVRRSFTPGVVGLGVCLILAFSCRQEMQRTEKLSGTSACQMPTKDNPFMNVLPTDLSDRPNRPPACSHAVPEVAKGVKDSFERGLFMSVDDLWEKKNGQRQFYTMDHTTVPNEQGKFARWLYSAGNDRTCKVYPSSCPSTD